MRGGLHVEYVYRNLWCVVFGKCACVFLRSGTVVSILRLLSKRVLPAEVSTAREAAAVGKSLSRL